MERDSAIGRFGDLASGRASRAEDGPEIESPNRPITQSPWLRSPSGLWLQLRDGLAGCLTTLRQVSGMPDYHEYVQHLRLRHPGWPIPGEREYFDQYLQARYGDGPTRCC